MIEYFNQQLNDDTLFFGVQTSPESIEILSIKKDELNEKCVELAITHEFVRYMGSSCPYPLFKLSNNTGE